MSRLQWPTFLSVPSRFDALKTRLTDGDVKVPSLLHVYDAKTKVPAVIYVLATVTLDYCE
jgi:hypothetical protein